MKCCIKISKWILLLWFAWRNIKSRSRSRHILRKHIHPHLNSSLHHDNHKLIHHLHLLTDHLSVRSFLTCSMPGLSGFRRGLVSTCSGTSLQPTRGISSQRLSTARARCSSVCFFSPVTEMLKNSRTPTLLLNQLALHLKILHWSP